MLRRQQAQAIIAARSRIVEGAVSMVGMALDQLEQEGHHRPRRGAQSGDGQQSHGGAVRRPRRVARGGTPGPCIIEAWAPRAERLWTHHEGWMMAARKSILLRLRPEAFEALQRWAQDEFRSLNGQVEFILDRALRQEGRLRPPAARRQRSMRLTSPSRRTSPEGAAGDDARSDD